MRFRNRRNPDTLIQPCSLQEFAPRSIPDAVSTATAKTPSTATPAANARSISRHMDGTSVTVQSAHVFGVSGVVGISRCLLDRLEVVSLYLHKAEVVGQRMFIIVITYIYIYIYACVSIGT